MILICLDRLVEVAYWPLNDRYREEDISRHGFDLTAENVHFNDELGANMLPENDLYLQTQPRRRLHFMGDMSITVWVYCQTNGGILQFRNGSHLGLVAHKSLQLHTLKMLEGYVINDKSLVAGIMLAW